MGRLQPAAQLGKFLAFGRMPPASSEAPVPKNGAKNIRKTISSDLLISRLILENNPFLEDLLE